MAVALSALAWRSYDLSTAAQADWTDFRIRGDEAAQATSALVGALGYGGLVHRFKDYLIRDGRQDAVIRRRIGAALEALDRLAAVAESPEDREAVALLRRVVASYSDRLDAARRMLAEGASAVAIDRAVGYDDAPASRALSHLTGRVYARDSGGAVRRPVVLTRLLEALGFGGVIHHFKNYILRRAGGEDDVAGFRAAAARARGAIDRYRRLDLDAAESAALDAIGSMISGYERRLAQATELRARGTSPRAIDNRLRLDDGPALAAIAALERALATRTERGADSISAALAASRSVALVALTATAALSLFLAAAIYAVLKRKVVSPARRLADGLQRLAAGDMAIDLSDLEARTEIGAVARAAGVFRDRSIELVRLRERMLRDSEARTESIVAAAPSAIVSVDEMGRVDSANAAAAALFGAERERLIGMALADLVDLPAPAAGETPLEAFLRGGGDGVGVGAQSQVTARRVDGRTFPAQLGLGRAPRHDAHIYTAVITDLTETKRVERMKSEFVSTVSHELRTPLTSIKGSLGLMKASVLGGLSDQARSMIEIAYNNCDRLIRLINDILDIEKIESGKLSFEVEPVPVRAQIAQLIRDTAGFARQFDVTVRSAEIAEPWEVEADPDRLTQVLTNLVSNAVKVSPAGHDVTLAAAPAGDGRLRISVTDRGPGVPEAFRPRIFQKFAQSDSSDTRTRGGTGLGLSICKAIIEALDGRIGFDSVEGAGATFWIELPLARPGGTPAVSSAGDCGPRVLICEGDADIGQMLLRLIREMGFDAVLCATAAEARERLATERYSAMTVDIGMPDREGMRLIRDLRAHAATRDVPVIVIATSAPGAETEPRGDAFRVLDWLEKPIDRDRLRDSLSRAVAEATAGPLRILHIEDEEAHRLIVREVIGDAGEVEAARSCAEARAKLADGAYDLVILDLLLPDGPGESLIAAIAASGAPPPSILVFSIAEPTARLKRQVDGVLVKSRTSNARLRDRLEALLTADRRRRHLEACI